MNTDPRIAPRVKAVFGGSFTEGDADSDAPGDAKSPEELLAEVKAGITGAQNDGMMAWLETCDAEPYAPQSRMKVELVQCTSQPDGNVINLQIIRQANEEKHPCIYYIHGGGMMSMSCIYGNFRAWGEILAATGLCVVMVDFRNALLPSSVPEVAPFPAGLNDCVSGLRHLRWMAEKYNFDINNVFIAGESGGGELTLATALKLIRVGDIGRVNGLFAMCPYIAGRWPLPENPSSVENNGLFISLHNNRGAMAYGIKELENENPLAWPSFASIDDVKDLPPTVISVNECDSLRDEGVNFYRKLLEAGVEAYCRQVLGTTHAVELFPIAVPQISRDTANALRLFVSEHSL